MFNNARFSYRLQGKMYRIYEWKHEPNGSSIGRFTDEYFFSKEEAAKRVYELNGWNYKQKDKDNGTEFKNPSR